MTSTHIILIEADTMAGSDRLAAYDLRLTVTITAGRKARTWANAADGFHPAEEPTVDIIEAEVKLHKAHPWAKLEGIAFDMATADIAPEWLLAQIERDEVAA